ncbi:sliding clamp DNA polymerase accessory protein [Synechococcus phage S-CAM22]|uniref:Sliding clamp n=1 Tax=Synechococcus phage S-CAM22 TaxID=1883365 RepID=A0A1D8KSA2_9CAUD|nr:DNA polymerase processivity factor [Synechococcus phage S-CAM22]YP_010088795.1 DNA polymerase processivity factor [Synechococcus phage S-CAM22]AOV60966.1 sliding clamp DNA polymerase accessory protein [Synechococcus phage S-CAM22]AOV61180.1 sliding clamp DNA polymerase accessory protein [Synechococcus phage S-CAM22]AOV61394.1 sliding clamp DNA polymerase accessory protein [Synechococcus phage S-CAM22]
MTVISQSTMEVLRNFCSINKSIVIKPGNQVSTLSINKNILAIADVEEQFDSQISIYDLGVFLGGLSLFDSPKIDTTQSNYVTVSDQRGKSKTRFFYADPDIITQAPEKEIVIPSEDVKFRLDAGHLKQLTKAAGIYQLPDLCLFSDNGVMNLCVTDKKNDTSNSYSVEVGTNDEEFCYCFKVENLKLLAGDYNVTISKQNVALFQGDGIKYFIALEPNN